MPKLKIKNWKGLYTNIDENEQSFELVRSSINFKHNRGFIEFENRELSIDDTLPDLTAYSGYDFEWETGIYCTLTNDALSQNPVAQTYEVKFLIAKAYDTSPHTPVWHRLLYANIEDVWYELSSEGSFSDLSNYVTATTDFDNSRFTTTIDGKAFFKVDGGRLKIHLPHTSFWFGRIEREYYGDHNWGASYSLNEFRLEKLIDGIGITYQDTDVTCTIEPITSGLVYFNDRPVNAYFIRTGEYGSNLTATGDKHYFDVYQFRYADTNEIIPNPIQLDANNYHYFPTFWPTGEFTNIYIPVEYNSVFKINGATLNSIYGPVTTLDFTGLYDSPYDDGWYSSPTLEYYEVPRSISSTSFFTYQTTNNSCTWLENGENVSTAGFEVAVTKLWIIITGVWDEREETILHFIPFEDTQASEWALLISDLQPSSTAGKRLTRLRVYAKAEDGVMEDFELVRDIEYINPDVLDNSTIYIYPDVFTGVTLNDNIGFLVDETKMGTLTSRDYKILEGFRSITTINDITFGAYSQDYSTIYYSTIGGGNLMPDLLYKTNQYQFNNISIINATVNINERFGVFTNNTLFVIDVIDELGIFTFTVKATLEFGVKNQDDVATMQGGAAINTRHGIYTTTGTQSNLISEAIDDIVKANFATSRIYYNKDIHELYYKVSASDSLYRFRFKDNVWEMITKV